MKKIGIDARLYSQTGVGTYLQNLLYYLDKKNSKKEKFIIYLLKEDYIKVRFKSKNIIKRIADYRWHSFSEQTGFLFTLLKDDLDLMHFTYFSYPIFYWKKFIATVHDTTPLVFKTGKASTKNQFIYKIKHFIFKLVLWLQISRAFKIITPSKTVKRELTSIYGQRFSTKVQSIYEGINYKIFKTKENKDLAEKFYNFFIYVGNFYPHKNIDRLIRGFRAVGGKYRLILIGPDDYFSKRLELNKNIILVKNPPLTDLIFFYKNAKDIIHPSLSEGFGLPLVEAAYFGTPIIASNIDVFKELWNENYITFDPYKETEITEKVKTFIKAPTKIIYGEVLKKYSFEKMTEETLKIYQRVTQNS